MRGTLLAAAIALAAPFAARAAPSCKSITVTALAFGLYDVYSTLPNDTKGTISYSCPPPTVPNVDITAGNGGSFNPRLMGGPGGEKLAYNVYYDSGRSQIWGPTPLSVPGGNNRTVDFYGRIFALQDVGVGAYTDTLIVTFNF
jgi:spore coat protein U-like protein